LIELGGSLGDGARNFGNVVLKDWAKLHLLGDGHIQSNPKNLKTNAT
jgi:hypothetical protein